MSGSITSHASISSHTSSSNHNADGSTSNATIRHHYHTHESQSLEQIGDTAYTTLLGRAHSSTDHPTLLDDSQDVLATPPAIAPSLLPEDSRILTPAKTIENINNYPVRILSDGAVQVMRGNWAAVLAIPNGTTDFVKRFFSLVLVESHADTKRMFAHLERGSQERMIFSVIRFALTNNFHEDPLKHIGVVHAHLGVKREDFVVFNRCFIAALGDILTEKGKAGEWGDGDESVWEAAMHLIASFMVPFSDEAEGLIERVSTRVGGAGVVKGVHETLMAYFQERLLPREDGVFIAASHIPQGPSDVIEYCVIQAPLTFSHSLTFVERRLQPCGRILYFVDRSNRPKCFIDLRHAKSVESIRDKDSYLIVIANEHNDLIHYIRFHSESGCEQWAVQINQRWKQFNSLSPIPTVRDVDKIVSNVFDSKQILQFTPADFVFLNLLGKGSFGKVVKVQHKDTKRIYAMKIIQKSNFQSMRNIVEVRRERAVLESVDCPFIVHFHGFFQSSDRLYFLFDFLSGGELFFRTKQAPDHHFDELTCRFYAAEIAVALEHLRIRRIVHRDIKGDNFVLDSDGHVVLTDFGFAKVLDNAKRNTATCGTLAYIAPEVLAPGPDGYSYEVDWWSLGVVMFTMLTGYFPFLRRTPQETAKAIVYDSLRFPSNVETTHRARSLCRHLMDKNPTTRISTLAKLKEHSFFAGFDWEALESRRMEPPFVPERTGPNTKYFHSKFTDQQYNLSQHQQPGLTNESQRSDNGGGGVTSSNDPRSDGSVVTSMPTAESTDPSSPLPRQLNVFSSYFFEQEEYASETNLLKKIAKKKQHYSSGGDVPQPAASTNNEDGVGKISSDFDAEEDEACVRDDGLRSRRYNHNVPTANNV